MYEYSEQAVEESMRELNVVGEQPTPTLSRREGEARNAFLYIDQDANDTLFKNQANSAIGMGSFMKLCITQARSLVSSNGGSVVLENCVEPRGRVFTRSLKSPI